MKISKTTILFVLTAIIGFTAIGIVYADSDSDVITASVTVPEVCIVSLNTTSINFGEVSPGTDTGATNQVVEITNNGNIVAVNTTIEGTNWEDTDAGTNTMVVGQTEYDTAGFTYGVGTALTGSPVTIAGGNIAAGASLDVFFGVAVPAQQTAGTYEQNITITMNC